MSPKEEESKNRKAEILEAAAALFAESGYYKTTTADVARAVGVTQPYVFHFFKSKEQLYLAVLDNAYEKILHAFNTAEAPPEQLPEAMGKAFADLLATHRNEILLVMMSYATPEDAVRQKCQERFDTVYERVKSRFEQAGIPDAAGRARDFIGQGMIISLAETLNLPKLLPWHGKLGPDCD
ncbi:TetR/AcrR family transcriptional regulator [Cohnella pontilimi]|uniref:TetR/AcrR family transcriptional regulator n=1 Tax=Cohnella pontilimi TaxID=2564100 RepID=A0A4U0F6E3_9BACL|nr:TetR/AcrR family transcriptional regulator [Cohnella pontilimi]TJY39868.1 TetR/AcrR family transcriptional regulator [Cohnella pontilimi]